MNKNGRMLGKGEVLGLLEEWNIPFACEEHGSVFNMSESGLLTLSLTGTRCKNLLLHNKKDDYFLVVTTATKSLNLVELADALGSKRLSFASADKLFELLGIRSGSLSPLALVNDKAGRVRLVIDAELRDEDRFLFHPLENSASISLSRRGLDAFLHHVEHPVEWFSGCARQEA
jgi:Ala-tRNA(Pro) deacylase